jgi:hypothetical protein
MTTLLNAGNPSLDEALAHFGVLGMKWGRTRARGDAFDIRAARSNVAASAQRVHQAQKKANRISNPKERAKAQKKAKELKVSHLNNPDRVLAARLTRGEKAVAILLGVGTLGIGATSATSRRIERKQELGKYNR